jgi:hypothetical protein
MKSVTADQVATLRAALTGDSDGYRRLYASLDPVAMDSYHIFYAAAFFEAASKRFNGATSADVLTFVADIRAQYDLAQDIDPRVAERLVLATFTDEQIADIPDQVKAEHYLILLIALIKQADLSGSDLDVFLADARKLADEWLN